MRKKSLAHTKKCSKKKSIVTQNISAKTKAKLKALSKELGVDEEVLASLCVMMWRMYGNKA